MLGTKIKDLRLQKKLTQGELSKLVNVPQNTLSDIEHNRYEPKASSLKEYANALGVTIETLLEDKEVTK